MTDNTANGWQLVQDDPSTFLDARKNPVHGRRLTYRLADGTMVELDVTMNDYGDAATIRSKVQTLAAAHYALLGG